MQFSELVRPKVAGSSSAPTILLAFLILASGLEFSVRGPLRFLRQGYAWNDFSYVYVPSRAWIHGENPYDPRSFVDIWMQQTGQALDVNGQRTHAAYPL